MHQKITLILIELNLQNNKILLKNMKIITLILSIVALSINCANAKTFKMKSETEDRLNHIEIIDHDDRENLQKLDINKLFKDAERYYKQSKNWEKLECKPINGFLCAKHSCKKRDAYTHIILDKKNETIKRCRNKHCEQFPAEFNRIGVFYNIQTQGPIGTLIRVLGDNRFKEITTVGLDAYIANGNCEPIQ